MTEQEVKEWIEKVKGKKIRFKNWLNRGWEYIIPSGRYIYYSKGMWSFDGLDKDNGLCFYVIDNEKDWELVEEKDRELVEEKEQWYEHNYVYNFYAENDYAFCKIITNRSWDKFKNGLSNYKHISSKQIDRPNWVE